MACEGNIMCGHGCLQTDEGTICVCPKGSLLQEDGHLCTGMDGWIIHWRCVCMELLLKHKAVLQDVRHQTEGAAVSSALLLHRRGGSAAVCQATSSIMTGSVALLLVSSVHNRLTDVTAEHKHWSFYSIFTAFYIMLTSTVFITINTMYFYILCL